MKFKKLESGRSMVEMLGVLAIIGVLSVGGIAGYSLSMRRHRANGVVDTISKYASLGYARCQQLIINGELTTFTGCESHMQAFEDTDIGVMPAGVSSILFLGAWENKKADTKRAVRKRLFFIFDQSSNSIFICEACSFLCLSIRLWIRLMGLRSSLMVSS